MMTQSKTIQKEELLKKYYDMACHNLLCYSKNYGMSEAKEGYEAEWSQAEAECNLLQEMMAELDEQEQKEAALVSEQLREATSDHDECQKGFYQCLPHPEIKDLDAPPMTREAIERFYEAVCQDFQNYLHRLICNPCTDRQ